MKNKVIFLSFFYYIFSIALGHASQNQEKPNDIRRHAQVGIPYLTLQQSLSVFWLNQKDQYEEDRKYIAANLVVYSSCSDNLEGMKALDKAESLIMDLLLKSKFKNILDLHMAQRVFMSCYNHTVNPTLEEVYKKHCQRINLIINDFHKQQYISWATQMAKKGN